MRFKTMTDIKGDRCVCTWVPPRSGGGSRGTDLACGRSSVTVRIAPVIIHTATGNHLCDLESLFQDVIGVSDEVQ